MVRTATGIRSCTRRATRDTAIVAAIALGALAVVTAGPSGRAFALQDAGVRQSVLAPAGETPNPARKPAGAEDEARNRAPAPKPTPRPTEVADAPKRAKLTPPEARELMQALRQLQASVRDEEGTAGSVTVKVPRPARSVTPPTLTSADIDRLVNSYLAKNAPKVDLAPTTTDVEFVRRVYFDLIGKPPTPDQFTAFVRDRSHDKRARLIDHLLNNREWARNWARYWRDVVKYHSTNENPARVRFDAMEDWLADQFQANTPWDQIVTRLITATGRNDENGAVAFPLAYEAQPVEMAGEVSRIFLGVQIQCAQCHDHKTDAWKRVQFHEFAAFFAGRGPARSSRAARDSFP